MSDPTIDPADLADDYVERDPLTLPLDAWHRAKGARMVEFAGYIMPIQYEGIMAEHLWTRENAGLFDVSHMGQLAFEGPDVTKALETLLPGDIQGLGEGKMRYSLLLNEEGGILDDLMVTNEGEGVIAIVVNGACKWDDIAHMRSELSDDITLNHREDHGLLALQGPKAVAALSALLPGVEQLVFMTWGRFQWQGHELGVSRSGYTGEDGFEISVPAEAIEAFADALLAQDVVKPIGLGARDSLRLEAGLPLYGHDLDETTDPVEGDLKFAVSKRRREEANFPGAARILKAWTEGASRKRVGLSVEGKLPVREGAPIFAGDTQVGTVTSGGFAPSVGAPIAMGFVAAGHEGEGTRLEAEVRGKRVPVTVAATPFVPHRYVRKGG